MSKYEDAAAKALREAKQVCSHRPENRSIDLESADEFCGDCGVVTREYIGGDPRRLPGRQALDVVTPLLKEEFPNKAGQVRLFHVDTLGPDEFDVLVSVEVNGLMVHRHYRLVRSFDQISAERKEYS